MYDAGTQAATVAVQRLARLPTTGWLDAETWAALWTVERPRVKPPRRQPTIKDTPGPKDGRRYWHRMSGKEVDFQKDGGPPWYPGRPFGPNEVGWHVQRLQEILGLHPSGRFNVHVAARVRGVRQQMGIPVSDVVDVRVAEYLDPGPYTTVAPGPSPSGAATGQGPVPSARA